MKPFSGLKPVVEYHFSVRISIITWWLLSSPSIFQVVQTFLAKTFNWEVFKEASFRKSYIRTSYKQKANCRTGGNSRTKNKSRWPEWWAAGRENYLVTIWASPLESKESNLSNGWKFKGKWNSKARPSEQNKEIWFSNFSVCKRRAIVEW